MKILKLESDTSRPVLVTVLNTDLSGERRLPCVSRKLEAMSVPAIV